MTATHVFRLERLWIKADALGLERAIRFREHDCVVRFPGADGDLGPGMPYIDESPISGRSWLPGAEDSAVAIDLLRVDVFIDADISADQLEAEEGGPLMPPTFIAFDMLSRSADIAREIIDAVITNVRIAHQQFWLEPPQYTQSVASVIRDRHGHKLPISHGGAITVHRGESERAVAADQLDDILGQDLGNVPSPIAEGLLVDANFIALRAPHPSLHTGLLLAAIATEVKVKETLLAIARPDQLPLVNLVLEHPRDWSMAVAALFDKGLKAVAGISLRDDDKDLFKAVGLLFEHRNRFAHRGDVSLDATLIRADLVAARRAFSWLEEQRQRLSAMTGTQGD